jgi:hypothetical protein
MCATRRTTAFIATHGAIGKFLVRGHGNVTFQRRRTPEIGKKHKNVAAIAEISLI